MIKPQTIQVKNLLTLSKIPAADYVINPYVGCSHACKYCYATFMKRFTNHREPWGEFVDVKICKRPINITVLENKSVSLSSVTDPYMSIENKYRVTRKILEQLVDINCKISILTKGVLGLRDIDLFKQMKNVQVTFSINTLDEQFKNDMDKASSIRHRIHALKILHKNNIHNGLFISPIFPEITN
jgi:DNA repair photolyase